MTQKIWDPAKAVVRGKFIVIEAHLRKQENSLINNLTLHLRELVKEQTNPKLLEGKNHK